MNNVVDSFTDVYNMKKKNFWSDRINIWKAPKQHCGKVSELPKVDSCVKSSQGPNCSAQLPIAIIKSLPAVNAVKNNDIYMNNC